MSSSVDKSLCCIFQLPKIYRWGTRFHPKYHLYKLFRDIFRRFRMILNNRSIPASSPSNHSPHECNFQIRLNFQYILNHLEPQNDRLGHVFSIPDLDMDLYYQNEFLIQEKNIILNKQTWVITNAPNTPSSPAWTDRF